MASRAIIPVGNNKKNEKIIISDNSSKHNDIYVFFRLIFLGNLTKFSKIGIEIY